MLKRHYHDCSYGWKLLWVINTVFNFTHRLSRLGEEYFSLVHLHTPIYCTLAIFPFETSSTSLDADITILDALSTPHIFWCIFVLQYLSIFISTNTFGVLCVISRVRADVFPNMHNFHDMNLSWGILRGPGIYHLLGTYCSI